jgi:hypothetical protein
MFRFISDNYQHQYFSPEDGNSMFLKTLSTYESTRRYKPEEQQCHPHWHENIRSHKKVNQSRYTPWRRLGGEEV